jgi:hypothetical protein
MSEIKFACPECGQKISCEPTYSGLRIPCPACQKPLTVPVPAAAPPASAVPTPSPSAIRAAPPVRANPPDVNPPDRPSPVPKRSLWEEATAGQPVAAAAALGERPPSKTGFSVLAMASLLCSVWLAFGFIPGILCGHLARAKMRANPLLKGGVMATVGLAISYTFLGLFLLFGGAYFAMAELTRPTITVRESTDQLNALKSRTVDEVIPGNSAPDGARENQHNVMGRGQTQPGVYKSKGFRLATAGGCFTYEMKVKPDLPMSLNCRYWGNEGAGRTFDIIVDDQIIATQDLGAVMPGHFFDMEYKIPEEVTRGKSKVTVEFQAHEGKIAGGVFAVETLTR